MTTTLARLGSTAPGWTIAWSNALAELELGVDEAEALLRAGHAPETVVHPWQPPTNLGQLPAPLRQRAQALLTRQLHVARGLAEAADQSRRQLRLLEKVRVAPEATPVYLDTAG